MDLPQMERRMPSVPVDLKYVELRLPGTFRELCANAKFSNDQIGRIVRCLALRSECFMTPEIEPEVFFYSKDQKKRLDAKLRKAKSRRKLEHGTADEAGVIPTGNPVVPEQLASPRRISRTAAEAAFPSLEASAPILLAQEDVLAPEPHAASGDASASPAAAQASQTRRRRTKEEKARDDLTADLFTTICGKEGKPSDKARAAAVPCHDTRNDAAWIPGRFGEFWNQYPRKVAKSDALKAFTKLIKSQPDVDRFMTVTLASLEYWKKQDQWTKDKGKFIPYPASWLNAGHWNDCSENMEQNPSQATFLRGDAESDEDLIKRMSGG